MQAMHTRFLWVHLLIAVEECCTLERKCCTWTIFCGFCHLHGGAQQIPTDFSNFNCGWWIILRTTRAWTIFLTDQIASKETAFLGKGIRSLVQHFTVNDALFERRAFPRMSLCTTWRLFKIHFLVASAWWFRSVLDSLVLIPFRLFADFFIFADEYFLANSPFPLPFFADSF